MDKSISKLIFFTTASFIERYDSFHGTTAHKGGKTEAATETPEVEEAEEAMTEVEEGGDGDDDKAAVEEKMEEPESSKF